MFFSSKIEEKLLKYIENIIFFCTFTDWKVRIFISD